ncbi:hypothetical protein L2Y96_00490 [Luteibacter aegosomaticola]|uniref:hypothetical protein n=1 Tax=Luteibacter aegosomaticola TaxID=2911538 RepID=UPI001FFBA3B5|nr:hypothetical protein [Luteibacter aegosomaticola]UPG90282.1 hypothetical protein L2Y96_00490 [Luteibacter aegosomaticola]
MNPLLERITRLYAPLGQIGLLMGGHYRFAPDQATPDRATSDQAAPGASALSCGPARGKAPSRASALLRHKPHAY